MNSFFCRFVSIEYFFKSNSMTLQTPLFLLIVVLFAIFFIGGGLFLILKNEKESLPKVLWVLIVLDFPIVGAAVYYANAFIQSQRAKQRPAYH